LIVVFYNDRPDLQELVERRNSKESRISYAYYYSYSKSSYFEADGNYETLIIKPQNEGSD
jgi:hypothetical protein